MFLLSGYHFTKLDFEDRNSTICLHIHHKWKPLAHASVHIVFKLAAPQITEDYVSGLLSVFIGVMLSDY